MSEQEKRPSEMTEIEFQSWLEQEPPKVEKSEDGEYLHVPIGYLEPDLRNTFDGDLHIKIKKLSITEGILTIIARIKVFHPVKKKYLKYDGIASTSLTTAGGYKGSSRNLSAEELRPEVAACYSEAIKNGCKKIGKRFGSDINRVNAPGKPNGKDAKSETKKKAVEGRVQVLIDDCETVEDLNKIMGTLPNTEEVQKALNTKLKQLKKSITK